MNKLIINNNNLKIADISEFNDKARAILIDENNCILVANYGGTILLPGGKIELSKECIIDGLIRELSEELGVNYSKKELNYFTCLEYFQKDYPKRDGTTKNRLVRTYYYIGKFKEIKSISQLLTENEKKGNFQLSLIPISELKELIKKNKSNNPRNIYFREELLKVLEIFDTINIPEEYNKKVRKK